MNDLDLCLEVVQGHVNSPKILELKTSNLVHHFFYVGCRAGAKTDPMAE